MRQTFWMYVLIIAAKRLFPYWTIYSPDEENVMAVVMSHSEEYIDKVMEIEI